MKEYRFTRIIWLLCLALAMTGCSEDLVSSGSDDEIKPGDPILFAPYLSGRAMTRATDVNSYHDALAYYTFTYEMYQSAIEYPVASGLQLYWPDNINSYGFKATAGSATLATDQTTQTKFFAEDKLLGYGAIASTADNIEALNYRTSKNWKADNATAGVAAADQKKIPIYLQHQRSCITVILKAGEGVSRDDLANTNYLEAKIYSYGTSNLEISPYATSTTIDYTEGDYGSAASNVNTTQYTAIVEPYAYQTNAKTIAEIKLSNQVFTFSASNDNNDVKYNLSAGQHLTITATLSRGSDDGRYKVKMTAQVTGWDITNIAATVDCEGQIGTTTDIGTRAALLTFLTSENNKAGNIANITADINLEDGEAWTTPQPLNCTMKMNDKTFTTTHRIFSTIGVGGKLVGGTISVGGDGTVDAAIAGINRGTIQSITVNRTSTAKATKAGLVVTNSGTISSCTSNLPVSSTSDVVGGIAMESVYHSDNGSMPVIEGCIANAKVDGTGETVGGGIVGKAVGRVSGNTFNYGITLSQDATNFKNIVYAKYDNDHQLRAYNNSWPTTADNTIDEGTGSNTNATAAEDQYNATIDNQTELASLLNNENNIAGKKYRVSDNFTVTTWENSSTTALFTLNGNYKTISTEGEVNLSNISSVSTNLTIDP